jgi:hypothetical protein
MSFIGQCSQSQGKGLFLPLEDSKKSESLASGFPLRSSIALATIINVITSRKVLRLDFFGIQSQSHNFFEQSRSILIVYQSK